MILAAPASGLIVLVTSLKNQLTLKEPIKPASRERTKIVGTFGLFFQ